MSVCYVLFCFVVIFGFLVLLVFLFFGFHTKNMIFFGALILFICLVRMSHGFGDLYFFSFPFLLYEYFFWLA